MSTHGSKGGKGTVLVVEDDEALRHAMVAWLRKRGHEVIETSFVAEALARVRTHLPDVVVSDLRLADGDAFALLPELRGKVPTFIITGYGTIEDAVRAVKQGAEDFLTKPIDMRRLVALVEAVVENPPFPRGATSEGTTIVPHIEEQLERLRDVDCSVLILGETGTGKSTLARRIHAIGARAKQPFVDVNCAGLTREFVESELFGYERGAFTGAHASKAGLLDTADGGTLFLDEIGDVDLQVQPKLLKVLEEKRFRRMGDVRERSVDVRLVAATHHDLLDAADRGAFRADLYYRISTVTLTVPALRERPQDIVPLAIDLLARLDPGVELTAEAGAKLCDHHWPGNIRELKNVIERALLSRRGAVITGDDLRFDVTRMKHQALGPRTTEEPASRSRLLAADATGATRDELEREHIRVALEAENGRVPAAAQRLGMSRSTLYEKLKTYGITATRRWASK